MKQPKQGLPWHSLDFAGLIRLSKKREKSAKVIKETNLVQKEIKKI